jgi:uncharacterized membrane protein YtjA (UPF0391 family)
MGRRRGRRGKGDLMFLIVAVVLAVLWGLGLFAFHAASGLIHLLLVIALVSMVVHFMRAAKARM